MHPESGHSNARRRGDDGESMALSFLTDKGLHLLEAGWQCRLGEIDLIMQENDTLVFVEVRSRRESNLVSALESIDTKKQKRLVRAARAWLACHPEAGELPARFDIVAIDGDALNWLRDALSVPAY